MAASARETALRCLIACEKQGAWPDGYLRSAIRRDALNHRDAALCTQLAWGVLQNRMLLDWHLDRFSSVKVERMEPAVRNSLRLGLYQLLFLDRIPVHAAVNESVSLARQFSRSRKAPGFVNAVLRSAERANADGLPEPEELAVRYSHPEWIVKEFSRILPEGETEALLAADNSQPLKTAQVNTLKTTVEELREELTAAGITAVPHPWLPDCLELMDTGDLEALPSFRNGHFYIQDAAAKLAVLAAGVQPGMTVLDACAAPGGKSFAAAIQMKDKGEILSCDIHPRKQKQIQEGAARLEIQCITAAVMDATLFDPALEKRFDVVIVDAPCSGLGVIRKKPDIRYKAPKPLEGLPKVQLSILENVSRYVKPYGILLYATCTLLERENGAVTAAFLEKHSDEFQFSPFPFPGSAGKEAEATLWPHRHGTDGFFFARLQRTAQTEANQ